jgi:hypothetical protein
MTITEAEFVYLQANSTRLPRDIREHVEDGRGVDNLNNHGGCSADARRWLDANPMPTEESITRISQLRVGDVVRLTGMSWGAAYADTEATVTRIERNRAHLTGTFVIEDQESPFSESWPWTFVRHAEPTPETGGESPEVPEGLVFTEYHPALLPLFTKAALAADEAGYCSEYDAIASEIGAPSRDEIKQLAGKEFTISFPMTVNVTTTVKGLNQDDAQRRFRQTIDYPAIRAMIETAITGNRYGDPIQRNTSGYEAQYQSNWTVTESPTP